MEGTKELITTDAIRSKVYILDSRITTLAFRNPAITIATFGEQAMD